eukprot:TRINITY_DN3477_c0_g2_i2.p1 TRINITY_DN3477_c0_g2~~TRINITY_DN3477_c0_g2_i2.p1  ORF type:complete len:1340 (+),score=528.09 TRINITY_DN3477_c0_g2_i2:123-4142(+)
MEKEGKKDQADKEKELEKEKEEKEKSQQMEKEKQMQAGGKDADKDKQAEEAKKQAQIEVGDKVRMRDRTAEEWRSGVVTDIDKDGIFVKPDGGSRAFTWEHVELVSKAFSKADTTPGRFAVGQKVRVRDSDREGWRRGEVTGHSGDKPLVKILGAQRSFTWAMCEADPEADKEAEKENEKEKEKEKEKDKSASFSPGDRVQVRDSDREQWRNGEVTSLSGGRPLVKVDGQSRAFTWQQVQLLSEKKEEPKWKEGDRVRMRDRATEAWREGTVTGLNSQGRPIVKADGASRGFTWEQVEKLTSGKDPGKDAPRSAAAASHRVGDRVRVRDSSSQQWREGTVTEVRTDGRPVVKVDGNARAFTWEYVEPAASSGAAAWQVGEKVRMRDAESEQWREGVVAEVVGGEPKVKHEGGSKAFTWKFVERISAAGGSGGAVAGSERKLQKGDRAKVRDTQQEAWKYGEVTEVDGSRLKVKVDGQSRAFTWAYVEPADSGSAAAPAPAASAAGFKVGDKVQMRDTERENWKKGEVTGFSGAKPLVRAEGSSRAFTWGFVEKLGGGGSTMDAIKVGMRVQVRDTEREQWKKGEVTGFSSGKGPLVKADGAQRAFTWTFVEPLVEEKAERAIRVGDRVRMRDSSNEEWKKGEVTDFSGGKPLVRADGASRSFTWAQVELLPETPVSASGGKFSIGEKVRVRDSVKEDWKNGEVTNFAGDGAPIVKAEGSSRAFTWNMVERREGGAHFARGDRVRVRDSEHEGWKNGEVTEVDGSRLKVKVDGQSRAFTWAYVEPADSGSAAAPAPAASAAGFKVGDKVQMRDTERENWKKGEVTGFSGAKPLVRAEGSSRAFTWGFVEKLGGGGSTMDAIKVGMRVQVRDTEREQWKKGEVTGFSSGKGPLVKADGAQRAFTWTFVEPLVEEKAERAIRVGDRVRMRDSSNEEWKKGEVTDFSGGKPLVRADGASRSFTWAQVELLPETPVSASGGKFSIGEKVRVRDSVKEDWKNGEVTNFAGDGAPIVKAEGSSRAFTWNMVERREGGAHFARGDRVRVRDSEHEGWKNGEVTEVDGSRVKVRTDGASRAFTWNFVEPAPAAAASSEGFRVGDRVQMRDTEKEAWKRGEVTGFSGAKPLVKADGATRAFTWAMVEAEKEDKRPQPSAPRPFLKGDRVRVRDSEREAWKNGEVTETDGTRPKVRVDGASRAFTWEMCEHVGSGHMLPAALQPKSASAASSSSSASTGFAVHERVRVRDSDREAWKTGVVTGFDRGRPTVKLEGSSTRSFTWAYVEKLGTGSSGGATAKLKEGDKVRARDSEREEWKTGTVQGFSNSDQPLVLIDGHKRAFVWKFVERV